MHSPPSKPHKDLLLILPYNIRSVHLAVYSLTLCRPTQIFATWAHLDLIFRSPPSSPGHVLSQTGLTNSNLRHLDPLRSDPDPLV
ncbi:hypothetical protein PtB15_4B364 [Puccinia triticina]|nr:hypothetical protein PtB15_4B364 [Puccinia triticina]